MFSLGDLGGGSPVIQEASRVPKMGECDVFDPQDSDVVENPDKRS